jgi:DNA-directed RNA polymerase specialized sigma24 family protein
MATPQAAVQAQRTLDSTRLGDHLDRLYRAAWALSGSRADAEDLVQETYARVLARPRLGIDARSPVSPLSRGSTTPKGSHDQARFDSRG